MLAPFQFLTPLALSCCNDKRSFLQTSNSRHQENLSLKNQSLHLNICIKSAIEWQRATARKWVEKHMQIKRSIIIVSLFPYGHLCIMNFKLHRRHSWPVLLAVKCHYFMLCATSYCEFQITFKCSQACTSRAFSATLPMLWAHSKGKFPTSFGQFSVSYLNSEGRIIKTSRQGERERIVKDG